MRTNKYYFLRGRWVHIRVFLGSSRMRIREKWLNKLKNFLNKDF